ncbi:MAG: hypothetical protein GY816_15365 [Cytophagales bacterium]|nr:hypothetical protein [Cytophagales bacterium]
MTTSKDQNCPFGDGLVRKIFKISDGNWMVECRQTGIQFAQKYPIIESLGTEVYSEKYYMKHLAQLDDRKMKTTQLVEEFKRLFPNVSKNNF